MHSVLAWIYSGLRRVVARVQQAALFDREQEDESVDEAQQLLEVLMRRDDNRNSGSRECRDREMAFAHRDGRRGAEFGEAERVPQKLLYESAGLGRGVEVDAFERGTNAFDCACAIRKARP